MEDSGIYGLLGIRHIFLGDLIFSLMALRGYLYSNIFQSFSGANTGLYSEKQGFGLGYLTC